MCHSLERRFGVQAPVSASTGQAARLMERPSPATTKQLYALTAWGLPAPPAALIQDSQLLWIPAAGLCFLRFWKSHALMAVLVCSVLAVVSSPFYIVATYLLVFTGFEAGSPIYHETLSRHAVCSWRGGYSTLMAPQLLY